MKGIVAKSLLAIFVLVSTLAAQDNSYPVYDQQTLTGRALTLMYVYPMSRDFTGGGARAKGMGGAFLGVSDDVSAVTWNPAGLYRQDDQYSQPVVGLGYKSISSDATFRDKMYLDFPWYESSSQDDFGGVDFMGIVVPLRIKGHVFVGSMAYSRLGDEYYNSAMSLDVMMPFTGIDSSTATTRPFSYDYGAEYRSWVNAYNFGFGTRVYRNVSFGLAANAYGGGAAQEINEVAAWDELLIPGMAPQRGHVEVLNDVVDTTTYSGIFFTLGFKLNSDRFNAGVVFKTPHVLKEMTDYRTDHVITANGLELANSATTMHTDNQLIEIDQPLVMGAGASYKVLENLLVAGDMEYRSYGGCKINRRDSLQLVPGGTDIEYFTEIDPHWNNTMVMRLGTEYMWSTGSQLVPLVPLRAGFGWMQVPEPNVVGGKVTYVNLAAVPEGLEYETASMTRFAFGAGIHWSQIHLDFSYETYSQDWKNTAFVRESSVDNNAFDLTFTGFF